MAQLTNIGEQVANGGPTQECWSCHDMRATHFCTSCGKIQAPAGMDYFSFFGLPRKLEIDTAALEKEFYKLSRRLHPDLYGRATEQEQRFALEKSSQLNDAYRTLRDPIGRTEYLLKLYGFQLEEQSKAATEKARQTGETKKQVVPPEMLEEVFELNMQLEELRMTKKLGAADPETVAGLQQAKKNFEAKLEAINTDLRAVWEQWDALPLDAAPDAGERKAVLGRLLDVLNRRTYIRNLVRDVNEALL